MVGDDKQPWILGRERGGSERVEEEWEYATDNIVMIHKWLWLFALSLSLHMPYSHFVLKVFTLKISHKKKNLYT